MCILFVYHCMWKWYRTGRKGRRLERRSAFRNGFRTAKRIFAEQVERFEMRFFFRDDVLFFLYDTISTYNDTQTEYTL
jgi:hypothetical protein